MNRLQEGMIGWTHFGQEVLLFYLVFIVLHASDSPLPKAISFLILVLIATTLYAFLAYKTKSVKLAAIPLPFMIVFGVLLGFHIGVAGAIALLIFWRVILYINDEAEYSSFLVFFITLGIGLTFYIFQDSGTYTYLFIIFVQLLLSLLIKSFEVFFSSSINSEERNLYHKWLLSVSVIVIILSLLVGFTFPYVKAFAGFILQTFITLVGLLMSPLLYFLEFIISKMTGVEMESNTIVEGERGAFPDQANESMSIFDIPASAIYIAFAILFLLVFYFIIKKLGNRINSSDSIIIVEENNYHFLNTKEKKNPWAVFKKIFLPQNEVRKHFYHLEKKIAKFGFGREKGKTVEEWLSSLPIKNSLRSEIETTYYKVRYGDQSFEQEELITYKKAIKEAITMVEEGKEKKDENFNE